MTAHYARIHDTTIREAFDHYQRQRVNIAGQTLGYDPDAIVARGRALREAEVRW